MGIIQIMTANNQIINFMKTIRFSKLDLFFNRLHVAMGGKGKTMPAVIRKEIMDELTSEEKKLGRKYNLTDLKISTMKVMKKYDPNNA